MALVKCPDCGKMVSSRVQACPECGCPAEFFENSDTQSVSLPSDIQEAASPVEQEEMVEFDLLTHTCKIPKNISGVASMLGDFLIKGDNASNTIEKYYANAHNMNTVMENYMNWFHEILLPIERDVFSYLHKQGIEMMDYEFYSKHKNVVGIEFEGAIDDVVARYCNILGAKDDLAAIRQAEKDGRGRWEGGGFGIKGAIKGAIQASAMNMVSDAIHSIGDSAKASSDAAAINNALNAMYNDDNTVLVLSHTVKQRIIGLYVALFEELQDKGKISNRYKIDTIASAKIIINSDQYDTTNKEKCTARVKAIMLDPTNIYNYEDVYRIMLNSDNDFDKWISFWGLEPFFDSYNKDKVKVKKAQEIAERLQLDSFDYDNTSDENVIKLRNVLFEEYCATGCLFDQYTPVGMQITDFKSRINANILSNNQLFSSLSNMENAERFTKLLEFDGDFFEDYIGKINVDPATLKNGAMARQQATSEGSHIIMCTDAGAFSLERVMMLTDKRFWDSGSNIPLDKLTSIEIESDGYESMRIVLSDGSSVIRWQKDDNNVFAKDVNRYSYMANFICEVAHNLADNKSLQVINKMLQLPEGIDLEDNTEIIRVDSVIWDMTNGVLRLTPDEIIFTSKKKGNIIRVPLEDITAIELVNDTMLGMKFPSFSIRYKGKLTKVDISTEKNKEWVKDIKEAQSSLIRSRKQDAVEINADIKKQDNGIDGAPAGDVVLTDDAEYIKQMESARSALYSKISSRIKDIDSALLVEHAVNTELSDKKIDVGILVLTSSELSFYSDKGETDWSVALKNIKKVQAYEQSGLNTLSFSIKGKFLLINYKVKHAMLWSDYIGKIKEGSSPIEPHNYYTEALDEKGIYINYSGMILKLVVGLPEYSYSEACAYSYFAECSIDEALKIIKNPIFRKRLGLKNA